MQSLARQLSIAALASFAALVCGQPAAAQPAPVADVLLPQANGLSPSRLAPNALATSMASRPPLPVPDPVHAVRIKDISFVQGDRVNHLSGAGLVLGLSGTGGKSEQTRVMAANYYLRKGIQLNTVDTKSMSAVLVSAKIPAHARRGEKIYVTVSVADDAASLRGGTLNQTMLRGIDDEIYAVAQGSIIGGGVSAGGDAATLQVNHPTVGVCEAIVEREIGCEGIVRDGRIRWVLRNKGYQTATLVANAFNTPFAGHARAIDAGTVEVIVPRTYQSRIPEFIAVMGDLRITPDMPARVVVNQKTGTIILGSNVKISPVVFASENVVIATSETPTPSQPAPLSGGETVVVPRTSVDIAGSGGSYNTLRDTLSVGDLANALNALGVAPTTLINILSSLRTQGALQADLIIE